MNQKYVIATSTSVPLDGVDVSSIDDSMFAREKEDTKEMSPARKAANAAVDASLVANINKTDMLSAYMQAKFSLSKADRPHLLKF